MIGIIDYNMGNLASVYNACVLLDTKANIVKDPNELKNYSKIILPGVGAFGDAMKNLKQTGMNEAILEYAKSGNHIFGICLGMQLLFDSSKEFGEHKGLSLIKGEIVKFEASKMNNENKIPHVGWNIVKNKTNRLFNGLENPYLYFVHSYHVKTSDCNVIGYTQYGYEFASAINKENIYGIQPHPEKSHTNGLKVLKNFMSIK